VERY